MKISKQTSQKKAKSRGSIFKPTADTHRVRFIPVNEPQEKAFYQFSSVRLNGNYYTMPFRKTGMNESKDPQNYYSGLIQPVYGGDPSLYTSVKLQDKYIFYLVELDESSNIIPNSETGDKLQVFYPSPGLAHDIEDQAEELESKGVEAFGNPGVAFQIVKGISKKTGFNDYSKSSFETSPFNLSNYEELSREAASKEIPSQFSTRKEVEIALKNVVRDRFELPYETLSERSSHHTSSGNDGEDESFDEFQKHLQEQIEAE